MGAGVIPFSDCNGEVHFLFQKVFAGRKTGYLIDFGGGATLGEDYPQTAMREFVEETETMYFAENIRTAARTPESVYRQLRVIERMFDETLGAHPDWWCQRDRGGGRNSKDWRTYFVEVGYRDVRPMNHQWEQDSSGRFKKRRELIWVPADHLLDMYRRTPNKLWKRVRQLSGAEETILSIKASKKTSR